MPWAVLFAPTLDRARFIEPMCRRNSAVLIARESSALERRRCPRYDKLCDALAPYSSGRVYANFIAADEADRVSSAHGPENYRRLRVLKSKYDPANVFHNNPNVPPICSDART
jgi:hypothetical protein